MTTVVADHDIILDIDDIAARYGMGRTKAYDIVRDPGFPASVVPGMTRVPLQALRSYELALSLAGTIAAASQTDPLTGTRPRRSYQNRVSAEAAFDQTVDYVKGARIVVPVGSAAKRRSAPTVDVLFAEVDKRWKQKGRNGRYIEKRTGTYNKWIQPACGDRAVLDWGSSDSQCLAILAAARDPGLAPATIQNRWPATAASGSVS